MKLTKTQAMKVLRTTAPKNQLRPYCAQCVQSGGSFVDWMKNAYGWVKDKVERVTNSDVYKAVQPHLEEYIYPVLKEQAEKKFRDYTGLGRGLNVAGGSYTKNHKLYGISGQLVGGSCCSHGGALRPAGRGRQAGGFIFSVPAMIAAATALGQAASVGAAGAAGAAGVNALVGKGKQRGKGLKEIRAKVANKAADAVHKKIMAM